MSNLRFVCLLFGLGLPLIGMLHGIMSGDTGEAFGCFVFVSFGVLLLLAIRADSRLNWAKIQDKHECEYKGFELVTFNTLDERGYVYWCYSMERCLDNPVLCKGEDFTSSRSAMDAAMAAVDKVQGMEGQS